MEINKNIILDLLPLYLADEASQETKDLVEKYLSENEDIKRIVQMQKESLNLSSTIPVPLSEDDQIAAYKRSRIQLAVIIFIAAVVLAGILGITLMMFLQSA